MGELRMWNLDDSTTPMDVMDTILSVGGCSEIDVKIGNLRKMGNGMYSIWAKCPLSAAVNVASSGRIKIGWTMARVELLAARPV